jgi:mono/diheme cytochrome c family protein
MKILWDRENEMSVLHDIEPCRPAPNILEEMIHASGAKSADRLTIAGGGYLDLLIGLYRRGFACVSCHAADRGPPAGEAASDVLWIPEVKSEAQLLTVIAGLGRMWPVSKWVDASGRRDDDPSLIEAMARGRWDCG